MKAVVASSCLLAAVLMAVGCSGRREPADQVAYADRFKVLLAEWDAREGNDLRREETARAARAHFNGGHRAVGWVTKVIQVAHVLDSTWIETEGLGVRLFLYPPDKEGADEAFKAFCVDLRPGDLVVFDGQLGDERSVSVAGALRAPEFSVHLERVGRR